MVEILKKTKNQTVFEDSANMADFFVRASRQHPIQNEISGFMDVAVQLGLTTHEARENFAAGLGMILAICTRGAGATLFREQVDIPIISSLTNLPETKVEQLADYLVSCSYMPTRRVFERNLRERRTLAIKLKGGV